ncbi:MAG: hypothetical protein ACYSOX_06245 [Planctomycetota bacterium]|jgi:hypothetical protein
MDISLKIICVVVLLATFGCASIESVETASVLRGDTTVQPAEPTAGAVSDVSSIAHDSVVGYEAEVVMPTEKPAAVPTEDVVDVVGDQRRTVPNRRLTLRQRRIFVLGIGASEKN